MNYSATRIGRLFGLNGQEMNAVLFKLGILEGKPGDYALTEIGEQFGRYNDYDNGYGGYAARGWQTISYDESIIDWIKHRINKSVIQESLSWLRDHRAAVKAAELAAQKAHEAELLRKQQEEAAALEAAKFHQQVIRRNTIIAGGVILVVLAVGITWFCIHRSRKKREEEERELMEKERAMEMAMNAYYYSSDANEADDCSEDTA